jgi:HEAT repeat protein
MAEIVNNEKLFDTMADGTEEEKSEILEIFRETDDISLIDPLVDFMEKEKSPAVRERILILLNRLVPLSGYQNREVDRMLRSPDPGVRNGIVEIIKRSDIPIIRFLEKLSEDEDKDVRKFVIDSLSQEKSVEAIEIIRRRLDDPDVNIVYTAIEYLGDFKDRDSAGKIESILMSSGNLMVLCSALEALARIRHSPKNRIIIKYFMRSDIHPMINFPLLKYLGAFGTEEAFSFIENLLDKNPGIYTKEVIDAIEGIVSNSGVRGLTVGLRAHLESMLGMITNNTDRYAILKLLAKSGGTGPASGFSLEKIREMLNDKSDMVKLSSIEILADIGEPEDIERLEAVAGNTDSDELLEAIGDAVTKIEERSGR